jgi:molecular chaperone GrpE
LSEEKNSKNQMAKEQEEAGETPEEEVAEETSAEAAAKAEDEVEMPSLEEQLAQAEAQAAEYLDGWQRERAAFANYRKRVERERAEIYQNATLDMISRFLTVLDDLERALENLPEDARASKWANGVALIRRNLQGMLEAEGVTEIEAIGQPFDPSLHEAVSQDDDYTYEKDHVIDVLQKGYRHGDRVLRPAVVRVAR